MMKPYAAACNSWRSRKYLRINAEFSAIARHAYRLAVEKAWTARASRNTITPELLDEADARCSGTSLSPRDWLWRVEEMIRRKRPGIQLPLFD